MQRWRGSSARLKWVPADEQSGPRLNPHYTVIYRAIPPPQKLSVWDGWTLVGLWLTTEVRAEILDCACEKEKLEYMSGGRGVLAALPKPPSSKRGMGGWKGWKREKAAYRKRKKKKQLTKVSSSGPADILYETLSFLISWLWLGKQLKMSQRGAPPLAIQWRVLNKRTLLLNRGRFEASRRLEEQKVRWGVFWEGKTHQDGLSKQREIADAPSFRFPLYTIKLHSENTNSINYMAGGVTLREEINHRQNTPRRAVW